MIGDHRQLSVRAQGIAKSGNARSSPSSSSFTAMRTAWNSRANSGGPARGPETARMAFTRSSLLANGWRPRRRTICRARLRDPALVAIVGEEPVQLVFGCQVQAGRQRWRRVPPIRISSGAPGRKVKPRSILVQLPGGDPQVEQDEVGLEARDRGQGLRIVVGAGQVPEPASPRRSRGCRDRVGVTVDAQHLGARRPERLGMAAVAQGGVHHRVAPRAASSTGAEKNGLMDAWARARSCRGIRGGKRNTPSDWTGWTVNDERG